MNYLMTIIQYLVNCEITLSHYKYNEIEELPNTVAFDCINIVLRVNLSVIIISCTNVLAEMSCRYDKNQDCFVFFFVALFQGR